MARTRRKLDIFDQSEELFERLKKEPSGKTRERLLAVSHGLKGELGLYEIARLVGRSRATVQTWFDAYRQGGIEGLCSDKQTPRGPASRLHPKARQALLKKLNKGSFPRAEDARIWLERQHQVVASTSRVRYWLGKLRSEVESGSTSPSS